MSSSDSLKYSDVPGTESGSTFHRTTAIYARQSRTRGLEYSSCANQIDVCRAFASPRGWTVGHVFSDEGESSETLVRPQLSRFIAAVEAGHVCRLIVCSIDRLTRRLAHLGKLLELLDRHDVELVVVNDPHYSDTAVGRLMTNIVAAASEFQQDLTRERMADMRAAYKRRGKRVAGRVPFGYQTEPVMKQLVVDPDQSIIVRDLFELAAKGGLPSDLASLANLSGWRDQNGNVGKWTARRILKLLKNRVYVGEIPDGDSTLPGAHEAIVSIPVFDLVQGQLTSRRTRHPKRGERHVQGDRSHANLLGNLVCGLCERPMSKSVSHRGSIRYLYYRCRSTAGGRPPCVGVNIRVHDLERFVCTVLTDTEDSDSAIPIELRQHWKQFDERQLQKNLPTIVDRVIYHSESGEITIELGDDRLETLQKSLAEETEQTNSESL